MSNSHNSTTPKTPTARNPEDPPPLPSFEELSVLYEEAQKDVDYKCSQAAEQMLTEFEGKWRRRLQAFPIILPDGRISAEMRIVRIAQQP